MYQPTALAMPSPKGHNTQHKCIGVGKDARTIALF